MLTTVAKNTMRMILKRLATKTQGRTSVEVVAKVKTAHLFPQPHQNYN